MRCVSLLPFLWVAMPIAAEAVGRPPSRAPTRKRPPSARERTLQALETRRVSFDFVEAPLSDVLAFLTQATQVSFALDTRRVPEPPAVTLRVNAMRLRSALAWTCTLGGLDYVAVREGGVIVTTPAGVVALDEKVMRLYDVAALLLPKLRPGRPRRERKRASGEELARLVRSTIAHNTWGEERGTSASYRAGRLAVVHVERVHEQVERLLNGLR